MSAVNNSDKLSGLMSSVEINEFDCRLKDTVELTAKVCNSVVELALAVDVVFDWLTSKAKLVCVRMDTAVDLCLSDSMIDTNLLCDDELDDHVISIDDIYIG